MFRRSICILLLLGFAFSWGRAPVQLVWDDGDSTVFVPILEKPRFVEIEDGLSLIELSGYGPRGEEGGPMLRGRTFPVAVPRGAEVSVRAEISWSEWIDITPAPLCSLTLNHRKPGRVDFRLYAESFGGEAKIIYDAIWRGVRVVGVDLIPVQYDPQRGVRFAESARVVVEHRGGGGTACEERLYHPTFEKLYRALLVNPDAAVPEHPRRALEWNPEDGAELLVIVYDSFTDELQPWIDWKLLQGMPTRVVTTSETGTDTASIHAYIYNAYHTWALPPAYVLFVADGDDGEPIPAYGRSDNGYGRVDGTDIFPDVLPGRMSADTGPQLQVIVQKHLNYEKDPDTTDSWWARAVGIVNEDDCTDPLGPGDSSYLAAVDSGMSLCENAGFTTHMFRRCLGHDYYDVKPYIEEGCNFVQYRGQAYPDYYYGFSGGLDTLPTGRKAPINVSITCSTGEFFAGDFWMGERSTRCGTVENPKGSAAFIGQGNVSSYSQERSYMSMNIFVGFFVEKLNPISAAQTFGKNEMYNYFGASYAARVEYWANVLLGSPEMLAWTAPLQFPTVSHPSALPVGHNDVAVTVTAGGEPVEAARIAIHQGDSFSYAITDSTGSAVVPIDVDPSPNYLVLVVSGPNIYHYIDTLPVIIGGVYPECVPTSFYDVVGDGDSLINPGETIVFLPRITNLGSETASGLWGVVRCEGDAGISFIDSTTSFPTVAPGDTVYGDSVVFVVSPDHAATNALNLTIHISGHPDGPWEEAVAPQPAVHRFAAQIDTIVLYDPPPYGNGDGELNPGEQAFLRVVLSNDTKADAFNVTGTLCDTDIVVGVQRFGEYGDLVRLSTASPSPDFTVSASPEAMPASEAWMNLIVCGDCPMYSFEDTLTLHLRLGGDATGLPTGPDSYGYYIYDDTDTPSGLAPEYIWNDITGVGSTIDAITDSDDGITTISLPFTFRFYGNAYNSIAVSSNGFLAPPGESWSGPGSGNPQPMPHSGGPAGVIALMWADLAPHRAGCDIYSYYDADSGRFIIQYDNMEFYYGGGSVTCQVVIYDSSAAPTPTGDNEIYFYYNYYDPSDNHGVGIESPDESVGLQYFLNGTYDEHAAPLMAGRALRITTRAPSSSGQPWLYYLDSLYYDDSASDGDGTLEPGDQISMVFRLKNGGSTPAWFTSGEVVATSLITPTGSTGNFGNIPSGAARSNAATPISFLLSPTCPIDTVITVPVALVANAGAYKDTIGLPLFVGATVGVTNKANTPNTLALQSPRPNPFNERASFGVWVAPALNGARAKIDLYAVDGRLVLTIFEGELAAGWHTFTIDGKRLPSGLYLIRLRTRNATLVQKVLHVR